MRVINDSLLGMPTYIFFSELGPIKEFLCVFKCLLVHRNISLNTYIGLHLLQKKFLGRYFFSEEVIWLLFIKIGAFIFLSKQGKAGLFENKRLISGLFFVYCKRQKTLGEYVRKNTTYFKYLDIMIVTTFWTVNEVTYKLTKWFKICIKRQVSSVFK